MYTLEKEISEVTNSKEKMNSFMEPNSDYQVLSHKFTGSICCAKLLKLSHL
jgi:hypothetical protein